MTEAAAQPQLGKTAPLPFRFQVGERTLFKVVRHLPVQNPSLLQILEDRLPPPDLSGGGLVYRSLPVERIASVANLSGALIYPRQLYPRFYADLAGDFESYLATMSANARSQLKRKVRNFEKATGGQLDVREFHEPAALPEFFALARQISVLSYQERLLNAGLPHSPVFRARAETLAAARSLKAYILFADARPVSYLLLPVRDGVLLYDYLGYDPDFAQHSPGIVLQFEVMRRLFAEGGYRYFDFTVGDGQHKRQFSTGMVKCADLVILPGTLPNRLLVGGHRSFHRSIERAGELADRLGLKARVRRLLRQGG